MTDVEFSLTGSTALVTGGAKRLGRATALALAEAGVNVVVHYRRSETEAEATTDLIRRIGPKAWTLAADLADPVEASALFARAVEVAGPIDVLINNASTFESGRILDASAAEIAANVQLHAAAPLALCQAMAAQNRAGHIVNFLDARIVDYDREHAAYHMSKRMLATLTRMLAMELAPRIAVNAVAPGLVLPPAGEDESYLRQLASTNPLSRYGDSDAITRSVLFLLGSRFITGQIIYVDGGRHMKGSMYP